jgi:VIT1/CCC1 family predicted Fe2+/Mn2+ transporter
MVARQLTVRGALAAHARDELGLTEELAARPLQAALASAGTFAVDAGVLVLTILLAPPTALVLSISLVSLLCLVALGSTAARVGGAPMLIGAACVRVWGVLAMAATAAVGRLFGTTVGLSRHKTGTGTVPKLPLPTLRLLSRASPSRRIFKSL